MSTEEFPDIVCEGCGMCEQGRHFFEKKVTEKPEKPEKVEKAIVFIKDGNICRDNV